MGSHESTLPAEPVPGTPATRSNYVTALTWGEFAWLSPDPAVKAAWLDTRKKVLARG